MNDREIKWLIYTVLVGVIPILCRLVVWMLTKSGAVELLSANDFVAFGLVLHISIINELEHVDSSDKNWKTTQNGISILFISFYGVLFALALLAGTNSDLVDPMITKKSVIVLSVVSLIISYSVFHRISNRSRAV